MGSSGRDEASHVSFKIFGIYSFMCSAVLHKIFFFFFQNTTDLGGTLKPTVFDLDKGSKE